MNKNFLNVIFLMVCVYSNTAVAKEFSQGETYLENFLSNTKTLEADFQQTLRSYNGELLQETGGKFYLNRPGKFRWVYETPYEQIIVSDGKRIWIYDVDLQQVTVQKQDQSLPSSPMSLLEDREKLYQNFFITPIDNKDGVYRLKLQSKSKESDFSEIVIGVDENSLRFMQLHDQFEQVTNIVFSDIATNTKLNKTMFQFIPPEGVDVFGG